MITQLKPAVLLSLVFLAGPLLANDAVPEKSIKLALRPGLEMLIRERGDWFIQRAEPLTPARKTADFTVQLRELVKEPRVLLPPSIIQPSDTSSDDSKSRFKAIVLIQKHQQPVQDIKVPISFYLDFIGEDGRKIETSINSYDTDYIEASAVLPNDTKKLRVVFTASYQYTEPRRTVEVDLGTHEVLDLDAEFEKAAERFAAKPPAPAGSPK
jgi:hypothetical protein